MYIRLLSRELVQLSTTGSSDDTLSSPPQYLAACVAAGGETQVAAAADVPRLERAGRELDKCVPTLFVVRAHWKMFS